MALTFLDAVAAVLARAGEISQDVGSLTTFGDSARSVKITVCKQCWNDVLLNIATASTVELPKMWARSSIILATSTTSYALPDDFEQIEWPLTNASDGYTISEYSGGFKQFRIDRRQPQLFTGTPYFGVIDPVTKKLLIDTVPSDTDDGRTYELIYQKSLSLVNETDLFPISDDAVRAMFGAVCEIFKYETQRIYDENKYKFHLANAIRIITPNSLSM